MATSPTVDEYENSHARIHVIGHSETTYRVGAVNLTSHEVEAPGIRRPWIRHISNRVGTLGSGAWGTSPLFQLSRMDRPFINTRSSGSGAKNVTRQSKHRAVVRHYGAAAAVTRFLDDCERITQPSNLKPSFSEPENYIYLILDMGTVRAN